MYLDAARDLNKRAFLLVPCHRAWCLYPDVDLTVHHTIEERHIFPVLGQRMPQFSVAADGAHLASHKSIHDGAPRLVLPVFFVQALNIP